MIMNQIKQLFFLVLLLAISFTRMSCVFAAISNSKFDIITKFPNVDSKEDLELALSESLQKLNVSSIYGYLAHNADVLIQKPSLWEVLLEAKKEGKIKKIGYSLYTPEQLERLLDLNCIPDLVQLPYSILDRKFEKQLSTYRCKIRSNALCFRNFRCPSATLEANT